MRHVPVRALSKNPRYQGEQDGGALVSLTPVPLLKLALGVILNVSTWRMFRGKH
jgi:hypothetical protein